MRRHYYYLSFQHQYSAQWSVSLNPASWLLPPGPAARVFHMTPAAEAWRRKKKMFAHEKLAIPSPTWQIERGVRHTLTAPLSLHWQHVAV